MGTGKSRPDPGALLEREYLALVDAVRRHWRRDEESALDLVHDAVVRVYESFGSFDPAKGEFRAWLWGILKHAASGRPQPHPRPADPVE
ncbi:MAG: hypothetical protein HYY18_05735, partial [Planctomycetes bacterium]|nr:hypothetical protein [Planctomycetota bacterium]